MLTVINIDFFWDDEAEMYVATSDDVPGLVTEAKTFEALKERIFAVVPELLRDNAHLIEGEISDTIEMCMLSKFTQSIQLSA